MGSRQPAEAFPPGEFLREELEARGWTQAQLAGLLACSPDLVIEIITGKCGISPDTARALGEALGTSPELWLNLDAAHQRARVPADAEGQLSAPQAHAPRRRAR